MLRRSLQKFVGALSRSENAKHVEFESSTSMWLRKMQHHHIAGGEIVTRCELFEKVVEGFQGLVRQQVTPGVGSTRGVFTCFVLSTSSQRPDYFCSFLVFLVVMFGEHVDTVCSVTAINVNNIGTIEEAFLPTPLSHTPC